MEVAEAFSLIAHALDAGCPAHGYLVTGDLREQCDVLVARVLEKLFPDALSQIAQRSHPDVAYLAPQGKRRIIPVDAMRERIVEPMTVTSFCGGWKVGVIDGADRMEAPSANAFLKVLEEPPPKTLFFLLTDSPDEILPTISSRTQRIDLPRSEGILRDEDYDEVAEAFAARDAARLAEKLAALKEGAEDEDVPLVRKAFFRTIMSFVRKMMLSGRLANARAFHNVEAVEDAFRQSARSIPDEAVLSFMLDRITFPTAS